MLNFYRCSLPRAASIQAPLHDILSGPKLKFPILSPRPTHSPQYSTSVRRACCKPLSTLIPIHSLHSPWSRTLQQLPWLPSSSSACRTPGNLAFFSRKLSTSEIQFIRPGAPGNLRRSEVRPTHAGGPSFHHPDGSQNIHLRLAPVEGQVFKAPV